LPVAGNTYDFIYAISIFTPFGEAVQFLWLELWACVSAPDTILILTKQGRNNSYDTLTQEAKVRLDAHGLYYDERIVFYSHDAVGFEYPEAFKLTFHWAEYVKQHWTKRLDLVTLAHRARGFDQDDPPPMAGPLPVLVNGWRFDQFVLV
jgi:hypothetical protein